MQVRTTHSTDTQAVIEIQASASELAEAKIQVLNKLAQGVKVPGFRTGKIPINLVEKHIDPAVLQSEFLEDVINQLYPLAVNKAGVRPVSNPEITLKKFVPYTTLEVEAKVAVVGNVKIADYKKLKKRRPVASVTDKDVNEVVDSLRTRQATKKSVQRASKEGDEVVIDFKGTDEKGQPVKGADGQNYPLVLGSKNFIPGFESNLLGLKPGEEKTFALKFPADYGVKALASRKVSFNVKVSIVNEVTLPKLDDDFAASVGPVKTVKDLKADIKKELQVEKQRQADLDYESDLVREITLKSKLSIPQVLIDQQIERLLDELRQNLVYRGQTLQEFLEAEGKSEEQYRSTELAEKAEERIKASIVLAEIADMEKLEVTPEELEIRIQALKTQYQDEAMRTELDKAENRRDIASRMLSEKTVAVLARYANEDIAKT